MNNHQKSYYVISVTQLQSFVISELNVFHAVNHFFTRAESLLSECNNPRYILYKLFHNIIFSLWSCLENIKSFKL